MSKKLLTELRSFAETTSVRGIPRVMKAKTRVTFAVWLVAVLTCAALLVWQLNVVLTRYFQCPVSTLTVQAPAWQRRTFPDVTVCNLDPSIYGDQTLDSDTDALIANLQVGGNLSAKMNNSLMMGISYYDWFGSSSGLYQITTVWDPNYFKCFIMRPLNSERGSSLSLSALLYFAQVNNANDETSRYPGGSIGAGLRVLVHAPGTAPDMTFGVNVGPGTETTIELTQSVRTRLGPPYSNCTNKPYLPWDNTSDVYSQPYCVHTCIQQQYVKKCGFFTKSVPQYTMAQLSEVQFRVNSTGNETINFDCWHSVMLSNISDVCSAACVLPCSELQYDTATSFVTTWPRAAQLDMYFYVTLLDYPSFLSVFNLTSSDTDYEISNATSSSAADDFFKSRFLHLNVQFGSQSFIELKDVAAFSVDAMGAQIGGVLSLWLGVTVMFAFEAFEFIYIYLTKSRKEEHTQARIVSVAPAVENPRRSAVRRSHNSLRRSSNRALPGKLSASKRQIRAAEKPSSVNPKEIGLTSTAPSAETELFQTGVVQIE